MAGSTAARSDSGLRQPRWYECVGGRLILCRGGAPSVYSIPDASILMEVDEMVDAVLVGLDRRELVTIPSLPDVADWETYTASRLHIGPNLSRDHAAAC